MGYVEVKKKNLYLLFWLKTGEEAKLLEVSAKREGRRRTEKEDAASACRIVEILCPGTKNTSFRGSKNFYDIPQIPLKYAGHLWQKDETGERLIISQQGEGVLVRTSYRFYEELPVFTCESELINVGAEDFWIDGITSFCYGNLGGSPESGFKNPADANTNPAGELEIYYAHNTWSAECRWVHHSLYECGVIPYGNLCYDRFSIANHSGLSSGEFLPEGAVYQKRTGKSLLWQIEHNGAWSWEIGCVIPDYGESFLEKDYLQEIYLQISGPGMEAAHWSKKIKSNEAFQTVPVTLAVAAGRPEEGISALTMYRRRQKQVKELPVIFNDYMNCMMGNSTTASLLPCIKRAGEAGCEIFVVDCGWYDSGDWQYTFGTFEECKKRYPGGLIQVMEAIRASGMKPGLWLELESFGIENEKADEIPKDWLFCRHGRPVVDSGRYHMDFRNPAVRENASSIIKRVIDTYGLRYLKIDYNLCSGWGTDLKSDSLGDGLLEHNRAYLAWLEEEIGKYPEVLWENCASGGLRMDYAMLSKMDIQSVSDQEDYRLMAGIAANCASAVLPEQAGIWSYPRREGDKRETVMNMVWSMLFRIHLGGHLNELSQERFLLVQEGIDCYKKIRDKIAAGLPYWPSGFHSFDSEWLCYGMHGEEEDYVAVCRRDAKTADITIPIKRRPRSVRVLYPKQNNMEILQIDEKIDCIRIGIPEENTACLLEIR